MRAFLSALVSVLILDGQLVAQQEVLPDAPSLSSRADPLAMTAAFQPGYTYRFVSENIIRMQLPGQGVREAVVEQQARLDATARSDGRAGVEIKARVERLKVDFRSGDEQVTYDSFKEEDRSSRLGQHFRGALNRWVDLRLNQTLDVLAVTPGGREGAGSIIPGVPQFGLNELEKLVAELPQGLPSGKVRPGESWQLSGTREISEVGDLNFEVTYRFAGEAVEDGSLCYVVEINGRLGGDALIAENSGALSGGEMNFEGSSLKGRILFDPVDATVRLREQSVSMLMELPAKPGEQPFQIPVEQQSSVRLLHIIATP